jgi:hypothetical protein
MKSANFHAEKASLRASFSRKQPIKSVFSGAETKSNIDTNFGPKKQYQNRHFPLQNLVGISFRQNYGLRLQAMKNSV